MTSAANGLKVVDDSDRNKRPLFWAIMLSIIVCMISSIWMLLWLSYAHGGLNGNGWFFGGGAKAPYNYNCYTTHVATRHKLARLVGSGNRWDDHGIADVLALTVSLVAPPPNRICHWSNLADGSTLVYHYSSVVNQGVYPQIWRSWRLSKSTSLVSRFDPGAVYL